MKVDSTIKDTPAAAGKILKGDEILAVNGKKLDNFNDFKAEVAKAEKGEKLNISIKRDGSVINKKVVRQLWNTWRTKNRKRGKKFLNL